MRLLELAGWLIDDGEHERDRGSDVVEVEYIKLLVLRDKAPTLRDATLISVLAYGGLRPGEALALTWADIGERSIQIDKALALGEVKETKTGKRRTIEMLRPLAQDLAEWRLACGRPSPADLVFPTAENGSWSDHTYRNWRRRVYKPLAELLGVHNPRPYDLCHSLASLFFAEGRNPAEIAEHMGHSLETLLSTYTHVIQELRGAERQDAEELIKDARKRRGHILVTQDLPRAMPVDKKTP